jgi:hypothetical protein
MNGPFRTSSDDFCHIWTNGQTDRKPKEKTMTNFNSTHKFTAAAAFGAAALFSMLSFGSNAEAAKSVASCQGTSAGAAVSCCEQIVAQKGRPLWMIQAAGNCRDIVKCESRRCYYKVLKAEEVGGSENSKGDGRRK